MKIGQNLTRNPMVPSDLAYYAWFKSCASFFWNCVDGRNNWGGDTAQHRKKKLNCGSHHINIKHFTKNLFYKRLSKNYLYYPDTTWLLQMFLIKSWLLAYNVNKPEDWSFIMKLQVNSIKTTTITTTENFSWSLSLKSCKWKFYPECMTNL